MQRQILFLFIVAAAVENCAAAVPRPEFPQPQFERAQWQTLNGEWQFDFDDRNAGLDKAWFEPAHEFSRKITVPYCFESKLSGIQDTSFHPWVWYSRRFEVPAAWKGRRVLLHFGAVDYRAQVWINGQLAGSHEGGNTPFQFDVTPLMKAGANTVSLRAEDPPTDRYIPRGKQYWELKSKGIFYTRTSGIWQPVWIEATGDSYLQSVRVTPSLDGQVKIEAEISHGQPDIAFRAIVRNAGTEIKSGNSEIRDERSLLSLAVTEPRLWTVNNPQLYDITFELRKNGEVVDRVESYFGFRKISTKDGQILLNDQRTYLKFVLDQGYWRDSILTPPTDEAIQSDIRVAKQMGFNGARKHQKLEDPRFLYWADKMGFLVSSEMANAYLFDSLAVERFTREWMEAVKRDYNHPSIVIWIPINESWGVPDLREKAQQDYLKSLYTLTHTMDNTRLVIDNDGWEHTESTDLFGIHDYLPRGELLAARYKQFDEREKDGRAVTVPSNGRIALIPGYRYNGSPLFLSEFGGIAFIPKGADMPAESWGYSGVEKTADSAMKRLLSIYKGIAQLHSIAGICYTQLTDVEQEANGLLTYDRVPKFDVGAIKAANDSLQ